MEEMQNMKGVATLGEAAPTSKFDMTKGGRTGGVETPSLLNILLRKSLRGVATSWILKGWGFKFDDEPCLTHMVWADHLFILASGPLQLSDMLAD
eukprot:369683-Heterocapsa_arctica.AAC.1